MIRKLEVGTRIALQLNWARYPKFEHILTARLGVFFH
jgi:hypothetical protein